MKKIAIIHNKKHKLVFVLGDSSGANVSKPVDAQQMADFLGISKRKWYRGLKDLERQGIIKVIDERGDSK